MEEMIGKVPAWIQAISMVLSGLVLVATAVVRLTPGDKDDKAVSKVKAVLKKIAHWLPTIGINPQTTELKKELEVAKEASKA